MLVGLASAWIVQLVITLILLTYTMIFQSKGRLYPCQCDRAISILIVFTNIFHD